MRCLETGQDAKARADLPPPMLDAGSQNPFEMCETEVPIVKFRNSFKISVICLIVLFLGAAVRAQDEDAPRPQKAKQSAEELERFFTIKVPEAFKSQPVDEPGILRWTKDSGEIYLVVGDLFLESGDVVYKALVQAGEADKRMEEVKQIKIKGGRALLYKEKAPEDPSQILTWKLFVVTDKKMVNIDFSAPAKEFQSFVPDFEATVSSFKLKTS